MENKEENNEIKEAMTALNNMALDIFRIKGEAEILKDQKSAKEKEILVLKGKISAILESCDLKRFDSSLGSLTIKKKTNTKMVDKYQVMAWLKERELYDSYVTINTTSIKKLYDTELARAQEDDDFNFVLNGIPGLEISSTFNDLTIKPVKKG